MPDDLAPDFVWAAAVTIKRIDWLWRGRFARGKLTAMGGDPGEGKGTLAADFARCITRGAPWPDGQPCPIGKVGILSAEDDAEDTLAPRLEAAGVDRERVGIFKSRVWDGSEPRRLSLDTDAEALVSWAADAGIDLLIIDPLNSYLGARTNSWNDADMRRVLDPLAEAAARYHVAILVIAHLKKGNSKAMYRMSGALSTTAAARFALAVAPHPTEQGLRCFAAIKANIAVKPATLTYRIVGRRVEEIGEDYGVIEWAGTSSLTANELIGDGADTSAALTAAEAFLAEVLARGPVASAEVKAQAAGRGIGKGSLWDAKSAIGVIARKDGLECWTWALPAGFTHRDASTQTGEASPPYRDALADESLNSVEPSRSDRDASPDSYSKHPGSPTYIEASLLTEAQKSKHHGIPIYGPPGRNGPA